jgi:hypothetical protein
MNPKPIVHTFVKADLKCYLCGSIAASVQWEHGSVEERLAIRACHQRRCARCGGALFLDEVGQFSKREEVVDWRQEEPRRGRPPKWLVEQRRRQRAEDADRAA